MPTTPLLETKLYIPRPRRRMVPRARLTERLNQSLASTLTLVSAPAGFGKTTVLTAWLATDAATAESAAWLSLDEADNDPTRFWTYLIAALQTVRPEVGARTLSLLQAPQPPTSDAILATLLNELGAIRQDVVLVLDDYHLVDAREVQDGMAFLLEHLPPWIDLVIASRTDPALPLVRMRARGELVELRAAELRFLSEEAAAYLNDVMGLGLAAAEVAALEGRTEGWAAALQLAALSLQGRDDVAGFIAGFAGDDRYIVDYLVAEVLQRQPEAVRRFLLQTAILDRLRGPLCEAVTGQGGAKVMLEALERGNLFVIPLDDRRQWYRYHRLFADMLRAYLLEEQADQVPGLHGRASAWFEQQAQPAEAIRHALAANDPARAAGLVEREAQATVRAHHLARLNAWLTPIPDEIIRTMPVLSTYYAMSLQGTGELEASAARLNDAERWLNPAEDPREQTADAGAMVVVDQAAFASLPSRVALARGYLASAAGDAAGTLEQAHRALALLPAEEHHWRGTAAALLGLAHWRSGDLAAAVSHHAAAVAGFERAGDSGLALSSGYHQADLLKACGRLAEARRQYEHSLQFATRHGDLPLPAAADLHFGLSELYCEHNDLARAIQELQLGEALGNATAFPRTAYRRLLVQARLRQCQGELEAALQLLDEAVPLYLRGSVPNLRPVAAWKVRLWLAQGRLAEALAWTRAHGLSGDDDPTYAREYEQITLARVLIAQHERERDAGLSAAIDRFLERLLAAGEGSGRMGSVIELLVLQALAHQAGGDIPAALAPLTRAFALAGPEGYVRIFVDEGAPMAILLEAAVKRGIAPHYTRQLLAAFGRTGDRPAPKQVLSEQLSERELDVLRLLSTDLDGPDIARELVVSLNTVRTHTKNIYSKLGVNSRRAAVRRAEELSLLTRERGH